MGCPYHIHTYIYINNNNDNNKWYVAVIIYYKFSFECPLNISGLDFLQFLVENMPLEGYPNGRW